MENDNYTPDELQNNQSENTNFSGNDDQKRQEALSSEIEQFARRLELGTKEFVERKGERQCFEPVPHRAILKRLLEEIQPIDYGQKANLADGDFPEKKHFIVITIDELLQKAKERNWQLCRNNGQTFIYNGAYWQAIERELLHAFFGEVAEKMGVSRIDARYYTFRRDLIQQFEAVSYLPAPERDKGKILINLRNGTFEITAEKQSLRPPTPDDFLTYQLPFQYDPKATAPAFINYLDQVLPDKDRQAVLQEYVGYIFLSPHVLKLEKVLLLVGSGANGKSVFIEIVTALLGRENVSGYSLASLTDNKSYTRAELATKLLNCTMEISGKITSGDFKLLASGEPIEARRIYKDPFIMENYAKFLLATNELPKEVEHTHGYHRRWLIVPFDETIPDKEQDKDLAKNIIEAELSGIFHWALEGLRRLLVNKRFTECEAIQNQSEEFKRQSDSVLMFISEEGYNKSVFGKILLKELYKEYALYCKNNNYHPCGGKTFSERIRNAGFITNRETPGIVVFIEK
jgi:putative DNA primase/helicase